MKVFTKKILIFFLVSAFVYILLNLTFSSNVFAPYKSAHSSSIQNYVSKNTLLITGDVMLGRSVQTEIQKLGNVNYPFSYTSDLLSSANISFINLENPIIKNCPIHNSGFIFCAKPDILDGVKNAGIDIVNLANNHTLNYGQKGLEETKNHLDARGIRYTNATNLTIIESNGIRFGFLGFDKSELSNPKLTDHEEKLVLDSNLKVDVLVVAMHWGVEYKDIALDSQRVLAKELVNLGADLIVGHHPHWVQDYEEIDGVPVYYSLGNFVFDQMWSEKTRKGKIVMLTFEGKEIIAKEEFDTYIKDIGQPMFINI